MNLDPREMRTVLTVVLCLVPAVWGRVVFLVLEGLTDSLMTRIPTPALDKVIAAGALFPLKPEFPAETLPTLQANHPLLSQSIILCL